MSINRYGIAMMNQIAMNQQYTNWSAAFCREDNIKLLEKIQTELKKLDFLSMSEDELREYGFGLWDEESGIMLVPLYIFPCLPNGTELTSISGNKKIIGKDEIDTDVRFGCMSYGIIPKKEAK